MATEILRVEVVGEGRGATLAVRREREGIEAETTRINRAGQRLASQTQSNTRRQSAAWSGLGSAARRGGREAEQGAAKASAAQRRAARATDEATAANQRHTRSWRGTVGALAVGGAAVAGAYKAWSFAKGAVQSTVELGLATKRLSSLTGLDVKEASAWVETARLRNVQSVTLNRSFITLARNVEAASKGNKKAADTLNELGVSQEQVKKGDLGPILLTISDGMHKMENGSHKTALAQQLFGRSMQQLLPMLNSGSKALQGQLDMVHKYGFALDNSRERQILRYAAAQRTLAVATGGLKIQLGLGLMPMLTRSAQRWTTLVATLNNPKLSASQKLDAFSKELDHDIGGLSKIIEKASPKIADAFAAAAPHAAMAFVNAFTHAGPMGSLLTGAFLLKKLGLLGPAFRAAGIPLGGSVAGGMAAGAERAPMGRWGTLGRSVGGVFAGAFIAYAAAQITDKLVGKLLSGEVDLMGGPTAAKKAELQSKPLQRARRRIGETPTGEPRSRRVRQGEARSDAEFRRMDRILNQPTNVGDTATSRFSRAIADASKGNNVAQLRRLARLVPDALHHGASMSRVEARALEGVIAGSIKRINANQPQIARSFKRDLQQTTIAVRAGIIPQSQAFVKLTGDIDRTLQKLPPSSRRWGKQAADNMIDQAKRQGIVSTDQARQMKEHVATQIRQMADQGGTHAKHLADRVGGDMNRMKGVSFDAMGKMSVQFNHFIDALGTAPKGTKINIIGGPSKNLAKQRGGWFGDPGERGPDDRVIAVAGGEAILTGWHQAETDKALRFASAFGVTRHPSLGAMFQSDTREHRTSPRQRGGRVGGFARGGFAAHSTAYGPPWGGIEGGGQTASGINLANNPHLLILAAPPQYPFHSRFYMNPNPFGTSLPFTVEDRGGAIQGSHFDTYVWQGHGYANRWGDRRVTMTPAGRGRPLTLSGAVGPMGGGGGGQQLTRYKVTGATGAMYGVAQGIVNKTEAMAQKRLDSLTPAGGPGGASIAGLGAGSGSNPRLHALTDLLFKRGFHPIEAPWLPGGVHPGHEHYGAGDHYHGGATDIPSTSVTGHKRIQDIAWAAHQAGRLTFYPTGMISALAPHETPVSWYRADHADHVHISAHQAGGFVPSGPSRLPRRIGGKRLLAQRGGLVGYQDGGMVELRAYTPPDQHHGGTAIPVTQPHHKAARHPRARHPRAAHRPRHARARRRPPRPGSRAHPITIGVGRPTLTTIKGGRGGDWIRMKDPSSRGRSELHTRAAWHAILAAFYARPTGAFALTDPTLPDDLYDEADYEISQAEYDTPFDPEHPGEVDPATGAYKAQDDDLRALQRRQATDRRRIGQEARLLGRYEHQATSDAHLIHREDGTIKRLERRTHHGSKKARAAARKQLAAARQRRAKLLKDQAEAKRRAGLAKKALTSLHGDYGTVSQQITDIQGAPAKDAAAAAGTGADSGQQVAENQQIITDLLRTFISNQDDIKRLARTETDTISAAIAAAASGQLGGSLGMALQSPGFPGGGVRY